jgi:hypothetical protein
MATRDEMMMRTDSSSSSSSCRDAVAMTREHQMVTREEGGAMARWLAYHASILAASQRLRRHLAGSVIRLPGYAAVQVVRYEAAWLDTDQLADGVREGSVEGQWSRDWPRVHVIHAPLRDNRIRIQGARAGYLASSWL